MYPRTPLNATTVQCVGICATRHKFETVLRQQVLAKCPGIELTTSGTVKGLLLSDDRTAVTGECLQSILRFCNTRYLLCDAVETFSDQAHAECLLRDAIETFRVCSQCPPQSRVG